ncbi:MAG: ATP synthase F0 subunit B, partial [Eubacteriales bacterium]
MQFIYALINFLILAALLWLFGRKMIASIFQKRLDKINSELDEAEKIEKTEYISPHLPDVPISGGGECDRYIDKVIAGIESDRDAEIKKINKQCDAE